MLKVRQAIILLAAELWFCTSNVECSTNFTECYNTTTDMHCFTKIGTGPVNNSEAQKWCSEIDATLLVIKNDEVQILLEMFFQDLNKSEGIDGSISYIWTNANRVVASKWQWLNSSVISGLNANVTTGFSYNMHVASLAPADADQQEVQLISKNPGETKSYICEFFGGHCQRQNRSVLQYGNKCYVASEDDLTWYDARNRCLEEQGDLVSFGDFRRTNINFTQWLNISTGKQYWVGARILWWSWKNSGDEEVRYSNWLHGYPVELYGDVECMSVCINSGIVSQINGWRAEKCTQDRSVGVVCHKVTSFESSQDSTTSSCSSCDHALESFEYLTATSRVLGLAIGIVLGVGIPVVVVLIVVIVVCVRRKRKPHSSGKHQKANSYDTVIELNDAKTDSLENDKDDVETDEKYWEASRNDSVSASNEVDQVIDSSEPNGVSRNDLASAGKEEEQVIDSAASAAKEEEQVIDSSEPKAKGGENIIYSSVEFVNLGDHDNLPPYELKDEHTDSLENNKDVVETDVKYGEVSRNDSASAANEGDHAIDFSEPSANGGENIVYSSVEIVDRGEDHDDLPPDELDDAQTDSLENDKDDVETETNYWEVSRNEPASATNEGEQVTDSSEPNEVPWNDSASEAKEEGHVIDASEQNATGGENIVYSSVEMIEREEDHDDLP